MKRHGNLGDQVCSFENLLLAARKAQRGKRFRDATARFNFDLEREILRVQAELRSGTYRPGAYRTFVVCEPVKRLISAAPYRDRVVHHALCNVIEPIFDRTFVHDTYANRRGKGTHAAADRAQHFCRRRPYVLKADISKFFASIDHGVLYSLVERKIKDSDVLALVRTIIDASNPQEPSIAYYPGDDLFEPHVRRRGLPIGNLTSQLFANVYLSPLDHFVKENLQGRPYVRYVDDFVVFGESAADLHRVRQAISRFLTSLRLSLHPRKTQVFPTRDGVEFVGYRLFPTHRLLRKEGVRRFRQRMRRMQEWYRRGQTSTADVRLSVVSWLAHAEHADTFRLRRRLFEEMSFQRG